jgi:putative DNA-invertase from lambdoid prophage Rac
MSRSAYWRVSVIAMNGLAFDLSTPHGRMMATIIAGIADFERELLQERIRFGFAAAKARGKRLSPESGRNPIASLPKFSPWSLKAAAIA